MEEGGLRLLQGSAKSQIGVPPPIPIGNKKLLKTDLIDKLNTAT